MDKSHLERPRSLQIAPASTGVPTFDPTTVQQWLSMPPTYETMVQRAETAQVELSTKFFFFARRFSF